MDSLKRVELRNDNRTTYVKNNAFKLGKTIGWFSNKYNSNGWSLHELTNVEKIEFGYNAIRSYSDKTDTTCIVKFNLNAGTYAFINNQEYINNNIVFGKFSSYRKLVIDNIDYIELFNKKRGEK